LQPARHHGRAHRHPDHNEQGELVAYAGRWPGDPPEGEGKYKLPTGFHKSSVVYNLHRAKDHAKDQGLIVVEGFFDCMRLHQAGIPNVVRSWAARCRSSRKRSSWPPSVRREKSADV